MATLWKVPLVLVCENNGYAISVPTKAAHAIENLSQLADGFGLPGVSIDGNDPCIVYSAMQQALARARDGGGPTLVECKTVRWELPHAALSQAWQICQRRRDECLKARADPIPRLEKVLREKGIAESELQTRQQRAKAINEEASEFAIQSPVPDPASVGEFVFAE